MIEIKLQILKRKEKINVVQKRPKKGSTGTRNLAKTNVSTNT